MDLTQRAQERPPEQRHASVWRMVLLLAALGVVLYPLSRYSFLAFHVVAEMASVTVAAALFMVAWHARRYQEEPHLLLLATAYLAAGIIDLVHTMTYSGMNILPGFDANLPTQLWLTARYLQALSLVAFSLAIGKSLHFGRMLALYGVLTIALIGLPMAGLFPDAFIEGQGLTPFKIVSEYIISAILLVAMVLLHRRREHLDPTMHRYLMVALAAAIGAEFSFTMYVSVYGSANLVGHLLKIASFVLVYRAVVVSGLERPFEVLFRSLHGSQEALSRERDNLTSILDAMQDSVYIVSQDRRVLYTNPAMRRQFGEPNGLLCYRFMHGTDTPCADCEFERVIAGETLQRLWTSPDTGRTYDVIDTPIRYGDGEGAIAKLKIMRDVTELKSVSDRLREANEQLEERVQARTVELLAANRALRDEVEERVRAEQALRISEERFRVALKSGAIIVAHADRDLRYTWMHNPHAGVVSPDAIGKRDDEILPPNESRPLMDLKREVLETGAGARSEVTYHLSDGEHIYDMVAEPLVDGDGQVVGVTTAALDITEQRRAQDALVQAEKLTLAGKLAASFAHEIKNPLQAVIGCLGLARELTTNGEDATRYFDVAAEELQRANRLVSQMRDMHQAPPSAEGDGAARAPADVNALVDRVLTLSDKEARNHDVVVERLLAEDLPTLTLVPGHLEQVALNLVLNALDAMPEGGTLTVRTGYENGNGAAGEVVIEVRDTGVGMSPEVAARVFEDFYSTKPTGLGLGLFICRRIVEGYGGRIDLDTAEGEGACFTVRLPAEPLAENKSAA